jgi:uncharacterized membrane protein
MGEIVGVAAALACTLFAGAALYINLVEHPARLSCGTEIAAIQWPPSYKRATVMQVSLALVATLAGLTRWWTGGGALWLCGSLLIISVVPFTVFVILPTNTRLLEPGRDRGSAETRACLEAWGRLHAVRTVLSLVASCIFVWALGRG